MPLSDFVNGYGLAEQLRIGLIELAALSLSLDIIKKIKKINELGTVKNDVNILTNKLSRQTFKLKRTYYVKHHQLLT